MEEVNPMFSAPIAGQSLTAEVGSQPWQKPPKLVTVQDAAESLILKHYPFLWT